MPTIAELKVPPPNDWGAFQAITLSALRQRWNTSDLQQNGRQGQTQDGVDIIGKDDMGRDVGIQCKNTEKVTMAVVTKECKKAEGFVPKLAAFYIATTAPLDSALQKAVRLESCERLRLGSFAVGILFWEDLLDDLVTNKAEFAKHFPEFSLEVSGRSSNRLLCILDFAYYGTGTQHTVDLLFGECGFMVQENPRQVDYLVEILKTAASRILPMETHTRFCTLGTELVSACLEKKWPHADDLMEQMRGIVDSAQYRLQGREAAAFQCGKLISRWNSTCPAEGKGIPNSLRKSIDDALVVLLPKDPLIDEAREIFDESKSGRLKHRLPYELFNKVRGVLERENMTTTTT